MCNFLEYKGAAPHSSLSSYTRVLSRRVATSAESFFLVSPFLLKLTRVCSPDSKVVYRRYASLFFIAGCASTDNELITLEVVHRYVEQMDKYYGNVCELDIIFNFQKAYFILDELLLAGEMQESSKKNVLRCISQEDSLEDMEVSLVIILCPLFTSLRRLLHARVWATIQSGCSIRVRCLRCKHGCSPSTTQPQSRRTPEANHFLSTIRSKKMSPSSCRA